MDQQIQVGAKWSESIEQALVSCNVAILFVSQDFLTSPYIRKIEMPKLLARYLRQEVVIAPIFVSSNMAEDHPFCPEGFSGPGHEVTLNDFQGFRPDNTPEKTLLHVKDTGKVSEYHDVLKRIAKKIPDIANGLPQGALDNGLALRSQSTPKTKSDAASLPNNGRAPDEPSPDPTRAATTQSASHVPTATPATPEPDAFRSIFEPLPKAKTPVEPQREQPRNDPMSRHARRDLGPAPPTNSPMPAPARASQAMAAPSGVVRSALQSKTLAPPMPADTVDSRAGTPPHASGLARSELLRKTVSEIPPFEPNKPATPERSAAPQVTRPMNPAGVSDRRWTTQVRRWLSGLGWRWVLALVALIGAGVLAYALWPTDDPSAGIDPAPTEWATSATKDKDGAATAPTAEVPKPKVENAQPPRQPDATQPPLAEPGKAPAADPYPTGTLTKPTAFDSKSGIRLVAFPGGKFIMGSPKTEKDRDNDEGPVRETTVAPFAVGIYEVTQKLYEDVMDTNPSYHKGNDHPVDSVTWFDAVRFCNALSEREGLSPAYEINGDQVKWNKEATGYRLPTEAEWEYAARAGTNDAYFFGNDTKDLEKYAWFGEGSSGTSRPVGKKEPSPWGLYDIYGNVWEWCWDWYADSYDSKDIDNPHGPAKGDIRVLRGGSYWGEPRNLRSAVRAGVRPTLSNRSGGFRICRSAPASLAP